MSSARADVWISPGTKPLASGKKSQAKIICGPTWLPKMPIAQTDLVGLSNYHLWKSEIAQAKYEAMWKHGFGPESTEGDYETHQAILGAESNHDYTLLVSRESMQALVSASQCFSCFLDARDSFSGPGIPNARTRWLTHSWDLLGLTPWLSTKCASSFLTSPIPPNLILPNLISPIPFCVRCSANSNRQRMASDGVIERDGWSGLVWFKIHAIVWKPQSAPNLHGTEHPRKLIFAIFHYGRNHRLNLELHLRWDRDGPFVLKTLDMHGEPMVIMPSCCEKFHDYQPLLVLGTILRTLMHWDQCQLKSPLADMSGCVCLIGWSAGKSPFHPTLPNLFGATLHQTWWGFVRSGWLDEEVCLGHFWKSSSVLLKSMILLMLN